MFRSSAQISLAPTSPTLYSDVAGAGMLRSSTGSRHLALLAVAAALLSLASASESDHKGFFLVASKTSTRRRLLHLNELSSLK